MACSVLRIPQRTRQAQGRGRTLLPLVEYLQDHVPQGYPFPQVPVHDHPQT